MDEDLFSKGRSGGVVDSDGDKDYFKQLIDYKTPLTKDYIATNFGSKWTTLSDAGIATDNLLAVYNAYSPFSV